MYRTEKRKKATVPHNELNNYPKMIKQAFTVLTLIYQKSTYNNFIQMQREKVMSQLRPQA